jgi:multiple sugar transport system ATP-binding protein
MASIDIQGVGKSYGTVPVLHNVDLSIQDGEFVVLVGPSGCGKSTLLRMVAGLEGITRGDIRIGGKVVNELAPKDRDIAMVFQSYALYPHMTVRDNMSYSLKLRRTPAERMSHVVSAAASKLGLESFLDRKPRTLSGGQRQRVAMGRSIVRKPKAFLFDEPLSNLDARLREQMRVEIKKLHRELGTTSIYVTHDQVEAMTLADRIVAMNGGAVQQIGTPLDLYEHPTNLFVASFIGSPAINVLDGILRCDGENRLIMLESGEQLPAPPRIQGRDGQAVKVGIRPEDVRVSIQNAGSRMGQIELVEPMGLGTILHVGTVHRTLKAFVLERADYPIGTRIAYSLPADRLHIFDAQTGQRIAD